MANKLPKLKLNLAAVIKDSGLSGAQKRAYLRAIKPDPVKREIGERVVEAIIDRTLDGKDKNDDTFKNNKGTTGYSKSYKESDNYKIYGKTNKVNLKLTGEMQAAIDVVGIKGNVVNIGFVDSEEEEKAHGHVYGGGFKNSLPVRDFWGLPKNSEIEKIVTEVISDNVILEDAPLELETGEQSALLGVLDALE